MKLLLTFFLLTYTIKAQWFIVNPSPTSTTLRSVRFVDSFTGWAVGDSGVIVKSTDGGVSWFSQASGTTNLLYSVYFTNSNVGWAVGAQTILKTTDGGVNWFSQVNNPTYLFFSVYFVDSNIGWAVGNAGLILKTTDGGANWTAQTGAGMSTANHSVFFIDSNNGWIAGTAGTSYIMLKTTDGGSNWNSITGIPSVMALYSVYFIDNNTGWAVGLNGAVRKSTNGGFTWTSQTSGAFLALRSVYFVNSNLGWAVGDYFVTTGGLFKTTNGGANWFSQPMGVVSSLLSVYFTDPNTGWAVGSQGTILRTTNGGVTSVDDNVSNPNSFQLNQNYPNPFNPSTKISWQSPVGSHTTLKIYDVLGNEVATLVDEYKDAGSYEVELNIGQTISLSSGLYFYKLQVGEFVQTKKMILTK